MTKIKYAYLKGQTWLYRRNYPADVAQLLGSRALKQSMKTGDPKVAQRRAAELTKRYDEIVEKTRAGARVALASPGWGASQVDCLRQALTEQQIDLSAVQFAQHARREYETVGTLATRYLNKRSDELRKGGFKSVRYSVGLFASKFGDRSVASLGRDDGRLFLTLIAQLAAVIGKSPKTQGKSLDQLVAFSRGRTLIAARTQKRIWAQVKHFLDWCVYTGELEENQFRKVLFEQKVVQAPYAVLEDEEIEVLLGENDRVLTPPLLLCVLSGMRAGEALGLYREDIVSKGNLGSFFLIRPNARRELKTEAAERVVPVHPELDRVLRLLPTRGPLFPDLNVNQLTKRFTAVRTRLGMDRRGLVFHSSRKWFITQCERTGVPEHFTASLVGHKSARSENGITYGIYSAGISDEQKRGIIDQIRLPAGAVVL